MRTKRGLRPVRIVTVELVRAEDGTPISSTRIRAGEIDWAGRPIRRQTRKSTNGAE